jgi:hypothetical protein
MNRRNVLKGIGASIALPFMQSLVPRELRASSWSGAMTQQGPQRYACVFMPNGIHPDRWTPAKFGRDFELTPLLQPLQSVKDKILVVGGLMNKHSWRTVEGHYTKTGNFLTSMPITRTVDSNVNSGGISVDQLMAKHRGQNSLFPSLQYGLDRMKSGICKSTGITRLYGSTISWESGTQPCSRETDARMAFDRMFRSYVPGKKQLPPDPYKQSVLDVVKDDVARLNKQMGIEDKNKMGEYLNAVRAIEKRLDNQESLADFEAQITPDLRKELARMDVRIDEWAEYAEGVDITEKARLMIDIMVLAFWSDASRIGTLMLGNSASNRNFSFIDGVSDTHHAVSHHKSDPRLLAQYEKIGHWHMQQYAYFLERLDSIKEGDHTLLDNSMILFGSGLRDGMRHSPFDLPIVVGGSGGGKLKTGQNVKYADETPLANLHHTMLTAMDIEVPNFGDSTGIFSDLLV